MDIYEHELTTVHRHYLERIESYISINGIDCRNILYEGQYTLARIRRILAIGKYDDNDINWLTGLSLLHEIIKNERIKKDK